MSNIVLRNTIISAVLIVLLIIVILVMDRSPYGKRQSYFAAEPKEEITSIELTEGEKKLNLAKTVDGWKVNGTMETRKNEILFLVRILTEMEIKSPVSPDLFEKEITENGIQPVKVRVFENNRLLSSFLVYKTVSNIYGNIMKKKERTKPFIVYMPGYEGDIGSQFTTDEYYWQPYNIFNLLPSEISSVTLENHSEPASSFTVTGSNGIYKLADSMECLSGWDTARVKRYISYFTWVPFENWASDLTDDRKEEITKHDPLFRIIVRKTNGGEITLTLWERYDVNTGEKDSDRLWGKTDERDEFFIVRYFDIDPLFKKVSYFCKE